MSPGTRFAFAAAISAAVVIAFFDPTISYSLTGIGHAAFSGVGFVVADALGRHPFEATFSVATVVVQPLAVKTKDAWTMLGCSPAHGWKLIANNELDSYLDGRTRKVVVASIHAYIERKLAAAKKDKGPKRTEKATAARMEQYANGVQPPRRGKRRQPGPITTTAAAAPTPEAPIEQMPPEPRDRGAEQQHAGSESASV